MKRSMVIKINVIHSTDSGSRAKSLERLILTAILRKQTKAKPSLLPEVETR